MTERWASVPDWPAYEVSDRGRVRRVTPSRHGGSQAAPGRVLRPQLVSGGYHGVHLYDGKRHRLCHVHRLVADVFLIGERAATVNHRDGDKTNNSVGNLEWATHAANTRHAVRTGLRVAPVGEANGSARLTAADVVLIRAVADDIGNAELARQFGVSSSTIRRARVGEAWRHVA